MQRHPLLGISGQASAVVFPTIGIDRNWLAAGGRGEQEISPREDSNPFAIANRHLLLQLPADAVIGSAQCEQKAFAAMDHVVAQGGLGAFG